MTAGGFIVVTDGIHAGACMLLSEGQEVTIGNGTQALFVLADDGIEAHHASARLTGGQLTLIAHHEGVAALDRPVAPGQATILAPGAWFTIGDARMQFSARDASTRQAAPPEAATRDAASRATPRNSSPKPRKVAFRPTKPMLAIVLVATLAAALWLTFGPRSAVLRTVRLEGPFRFATAHEDPKTQTCTYEGYVLTAQDLASLAAAVRRDRCASVMRVIVVDQMQEQLADFLTRYYRGARIRSTTPGAFAVLAPAEEGYLLPESWDYSRIARLARASINGLRDLGFDGHPSVAGPVHAPLESIGMNLTRAAHGAWLVDGRGSRYFPGAQLPLGKLTGISGCTATVVRDDDGTTYALSARGSEGRRDCS